MTIPSRELVMQVLSVALERAGFRISQYGEMLRAERDGMNAYVDPARHMGFRYCRVGGDERLFQEIDRIIDDVEASAACDG
jgi:hypothetical protein